MMHKNPIFRGMSRAALGALTLVMLVAIWEAMGQEKPPASDVPVAAVIDEAVFRERVQPLLKKYCVRCHNAENMESGIRVDQLTAALEEKQLPLWNGILKQVADGDMPPADEPQLTAEQRKSFTEWITQSMTVVRSRPSPKNGSVRRLTVSQYRNTLKELLGLQEDLTDALPPDGLSKDGFANNAQTLLLSPLQVESYFDIAEKGLDLCIVDEHSKPVIQNFRMEFGSSINPQPCPDNLILGANNALLNNADFVVKELKPTKPFEFQPFAMQTKFEFIEGYVGNDTIRAWKKFDSIYHAVFACVRGTPGYPKGEAHQVVPNGLLLRPAIPSPEIFGQSNTYGPMANFKISLRELPEHGNFRITVKAARYDDALLLDANTRVSGTVLAAGQRKTPAASAVPLTETNAVHDSGTAIVADLSTSPEAKITIPHDGIYQVDVDCAPGKAQDPISLDLGERRFTGQLWKREGEAPVEPGTNKDGSTGTSSSRMTAFMLVRLPVGELKLAAKYGDNSRLRRIVFSRLNDDSELARRFKTFEQRSPSLGVYLGLRRDCGSTLTQVGEPRSVSTGELHEFVFEGAINDFPAPEVEKDNVNYLAGIREIGVRSEYTDGRDMPRLLVRSIEFEGPFYESWPPATHRKIFIDSPHKPVERVSNVLKADETRRVENVPHDAQEIIRSFATRAFRRPVTAAELETLVGVWKRSFGEKGRNQSRQTLGDTSYDSQSLARLATRNFQQSIKDALLVVLTSPQFLFLIENSSSPAAENLDDHELASKLSYFLWNGPPDQRLLDLAAKNALHHSLDAEAERMIRDSRFGQFISEFASQWLSLDKFDVVAVDAQRYPKLTRDTKTQLRQEPVQFLRYLIEQNLPLRNLVQSDFVVANEVTASYYDLADRTESGFRFVPIKHDGGHLGGVLTQAGILAGLSDGRESNPIKRGAWLARKIIAEPPDDPPPNVPQLKEDDGAKLTLREKLERHRNQKGCAKCHSGIDPWGIPFETFDAGGLLKKDLATDACSTLPDKTEIKDLNSLKTYLAHDRLDQVAFSFLKHAATYAIGRSLTYNELVSLREQCAQSKANDFRMRDLLRSVIQSDLFLKK